MSSADSQLPTLKIVEPTVQEEKTMSDLRHHLLKTWVGFAAGTVSGWVSVIAMNPLDVIKTRMQSGEEKLSTFGHIKQIYKESGLKGFYKGMLFPLTGSTFFASIYYGSNEQFNKLFNFLFCSESQRTKEMETLPLKFFFMSGSMAGMLTTVFSAPVEQIKIRMQCQRDNYYKGSIDCFQKILRNKGIIGLYKSSSLQFTRDLFGCGSFFAMYEASKRYFRKQNNGILEKNKLLLSGTIAGFFYWPLAFPIDLIKTKMQSDPVIHPHYTNIKDCVSQTFGQQHSYSKGIHNFYKGYLITHLRTIPNATIALYTYDYVKNKMISLFGLTHLQN